MIEEIMDFLANSKTPILSTSVDNQPISRPIGSATLFDGKIYCCMNNDKAMFDELQSNPRICLCVCNDDFSWIRIFAKVVFDESKNIKQRFIDKGKTRFESADEPKFSVFYLDDVKAQVSIMGQKRWIE